jgi:hypothetical protein
MLSPRRETQSLFLRQQTTGAALVSYNPRPDNGTRNLQVTFVKSRLLRLDSANRRLRRLRIQQLSRPVPSNRLQRLKHPLQLRQQLPCDLRQIRPLQPRPQVLQRQARPRGRRPKRRREPRLHDVGLWHRRRSVLRREHRRRARDRVLGE